MLASILVCSGARSSETAQLIDHLCSRNMWISQKSLPRPLLSAAIVNPTKDEVIRDVKGTCMESSSRVSPKKGEKGRTGMESSSRVFPKQGEKKRQKIGLRGLLQRVDSYICDTIKILFMCLCYDGIESDLNEFIIYDDIGSWANVDDFQLGYYHLFYQYNPKGAVWGNIAWAHSVLKDMVNWIHLEHATIPSKPYDKYGCCSGSAMILPGDKPVIMYTGIVDPKPKLGYQVQAYAIPANYSDPYLREWIKPNDILFLKPTS
ncbi:glycoside hydrolase, family 32 [Tanacetum coccineum]